jgi:hypothetical protein
MKIKDIAELILDIRSLWQMYYVEGVVNKYYYHREYHVDYFKIRAKMAELVDPDGNIKNGCHDINKQYLRWERAKTIEESISISDDMIALCEKWLDENNIAYEK